MYPKKYSIILILNLIILILLLFFFIDSNFTTLIITVYFLIIEVKVSLIKNKYVNDIYTTKIALAFISN